MTTQGSAVARLAGYVLLGLVALFLAAPMLVILVFSFDGSRFPTIPWGGFSLRWHAEAIADPAVRQAFVNSVTVALSCATVATALGFSAAYLDYRFRFPGQRLLVLMVGIPPAIPVTVLSVAMLIAAGQLGLLGSLSTIVFFHVALGASCAMGIIRLRLGEISPDFERAAWNLGATPLQSLVHVIVPASRQHIVASFFLCAAVSFDEFLIAWFVGGVNETVPVRILTILQGQVNPKINAIGATVLVVSVILVAIAQHLVRLRTSRGAEGQA